MTRMNIQFIIQIGLLLRLKRSTANNYMLTTTLTKIVWEVYKMCKGNDFNVFYITLHALLYLFSTLLEAEEEKYLG